MMMPIDAASRILAFDTSSKRGSIALLEGRELRAEIRSDSMQTHSALLLKSVNFLLERAGWQLKDLTLIASGIGPGSFTGIRIGVATALGLAQSLSIPFCGVSGLEVLAHEAAWLEGRIGVVLDAHRNQVYFAEYSCQKGRLRQMVKSSLLDISDLEHSIGDRHLYVIGDLSADQLKALRGSSSNSTRWPQVVPVDLFLAAGIGRLAIARKSKWRSGDLLMSEPLYIRPPDALRNKSRKR